MSTSQTNPAAPTGTLAKCRLCGFTEFTACVEISGTPQAMQWTDNAAMYEDVSGSYCLETCDWCGLLQNRSDLDVAALNESFSVNLSSTKNEPHIAAELDIIFTHLQPRSAVDVGCNDGRFLHELRDRGVQRLLGIEPTEFTAKCAREAGFTIYHGLAGAESAKMLARQHGRFDLVVTRQVVEHIAEFSDFFAGLRELCANDGYLFIDVPDMEVGLTYGDSTVLWQEHLSFFTETTLVALLRREGFEPAVITRYDVSGGTLAVLARRVPMSQPSEIQAVEHPSDAARAYGLRVRENARMLAEYLSEAQFRGFEVVIYGTTRSTMVLNGLQLAKYLSYIVDDQLNRQGKYFPGTLLRIHPSTKLGEGTSPLICLLAVSHQNETNVRRRLRTTIERECIFVGLCAPGDLDGDIRSLGEYLQNCAPKALQ